MDQGIRVWPATFEILKNVLGPIEKSATFLAVTLMVSRGDLNIVQLHSHAIRHVYDTMHWSI